MWKLKTPETQGIPIDCVNMDEVFVLWPIDCIKVAGCQGNVSVVDQSDLSPSLRVATSSSQCLERVRQGIGVLLERAMCLCPTTSFVRGHFHLSQNSFIVTVTIAVEHDRFLWN
jgi:hypothetical protein